MTPIEIAKIEQAAANAERKRIVAGIRELEAKRLAVAKASNRRPKKHISLKHIADLIEKGKI